MSPTEEGPSDPSDIIAQWRRIASDTALLDRDKARGAVNQLYKVNGLKPPLNIVFFDSPGACLFARQLVKWYGADYRPRLTQRVRHDLWQDRWPQYEARLADHVKLPLTPHFSQRLKQAFWEQVSEFDQQHLTLPFDDQLRHVFKDSLHHSIVKTGRSQLRRDGSWPRTASDTAPLHRMEIQKADLIQMRSQFSSSLWQPFYFLGGQETSWLAEYFLLQQGGLAFSNDLKSKAEAYANYAQHCGWALFYKNWAFVSDRPCAIQRDGNGRFHGENGPALLFADGFGVAYCWHGVRVPSWMIREKQKITVARIRRERNIELRRCMAEIYGLGRYIREIGAELIDDDPEWGKLWRIPWGEGVFELIVEVKNSTPEPDGEIKTYFLSVHPQLCPIPDVEEGETDFGAPQKLTARNAVASTFGLRGEDYQPEIET